MQRPVTKLWGVHVVVHVYVVLVGIVCVFRARWLQGVYHDIKIHRDAKAAAARKAAAADRQ